MRRVRSRVRHSRRPPAGFQGPQDHVRAPQRCVRVGGGDESADARRTLSLGAASASEAALTAAALRIRGPAADAAAAASAASAAASLTCAALTLR